MGSDPLSPKAYVAEVEVLIDGTPRRMIVDTGAPFSYVGPNILPITSDDYYIDDDSPMGRIHARTNVRQVSLMDREWKMPLSEMNNFLYLMTFNILGVDGVIGKDMLDQFDIYIDTDGLLYVQPYLNTD